MACTTKLTRKKRQVCVGSLDNKITIMPQTIVPAQPGTQFGSDLQTSSYVVWAMVETKSADAIFDGTNLIQQVTHIFTVRYRADITVESMVNFHGVNYKILSVENLDERNQFQQIYAVPRGDDTSVVNSA